MDKDKKSPVQDLPQEDQKEADSDEKKKAAAHQISSMMDQPSHFTDVSRYMLNPQNQSDNDISLRQPPKFIEGQDHQLQIRSPQKDLNAQGDPQEGRMGSDQKALTAAMVALKNALHADDEQSFLQILRKEVSDHSEAIMLMYACVLCFNNEDGFDAYLEKFQHFEFIPDFHLLFGQPNLFTQIQTQGTVQRSKFEYIVLKIALERDYFFIVDLVLEKAILNKELIILMLREEQGKMLVQLIFKPHRPFYYEHSDEKLNKFFKRDVGDFMEREVRFADYIYAGLEGEIKSKTLINLIKLMKNEVNTKQIANASDELDLYELYRMFVLKRKIKLLRFLFELNQDFIFKSDMFLQALELEAYDIASLLYKEFSRKIRAQQKEAEFLITSLISSLKKNNGMIEFKSFLLRQFLEVFLMRHATSLLDTIDFKVSQENKNNILLQNLNTVKTSCLLIELLEQISNKFEMLKVRAFTIRQKIVKINKEQMRKVEHEREMRFLLLEKDFDSRDALDLITKFEIQEFLESQFAENVVKEIWRSPYATNNQIFSASTNHNLTFNFNHFIKDEEIEKRFYNNQELKDIEAHPLQFTVWRYSAKSRMLVDFVATVIMAAIIHLFIWRVLKDSQYYQDAITEVFSMERQLVAIEDQASTAFTELSAEIDALQEEYNDLVLTYYNSVMMVSYLSFLCLFYALQHISDVIYTTMLKRRINPYSVLIILDLCIFAIFFTNIIVTYSRNQGGTWSEKPAISRLQRAWEYARNYERGYVNEDAIWICCIIVMWVRAFYLIRYNEGLGKFLAILERLLYEVFIFFCFYLTELVFFSLCATLFFRDLSEYNTFSSAFVNLFYASFGQFTFDEVALSQYGYAYGVGFLVVFLIVNILLVMNMFISIINVMWDLLSGNRSIFQMLETLKIRPQSEADDDYSCLVSLPTPLNIVLVFTAPCLLKSKDPRKFNECLLMVAYVPILCVSIVLFLVYNLILWVFAYVKLFFHKLVMIMVYSKSYRVSRADKFLNFVLFAVFGMFILLANVAVDTKRFVQHMLLKDLFKTKHKTSDQKISKENFKVIRKYFNERNERMMPYRQIATEIRELLHVMESLIKVMRPKGLMKFYMGRQDKQNLTQKINALYEQNEHIDHLENLMSTLSRVKEYSTLKQIMERNSEQISVKDGMKVKSIDCKVFSTMLADISRHEKVMKIEDDNYIFIRRARNLRQRRLVDKANKYRVSEVEEEDQDKLEDELRKYQRLKASFKRLMFFNSRRMLALLNHDDIDQDRRRLAHSVKIAQQRGKMLDISVDSKGDLQNYPKGGEKGLNFGDIETLEQNVYEMGQSLPKVGMAIEQMKYEIQGVVQALEKQGGPGQKLSSDYKEKLGKLMEDLEYIKDDRQGQQVRSNVMSSYFYNEEANKPPQIMSAQKMNYFSNQKDRNTQVLMSIAIKNEESDVPDVEDEQDAVDDDEEEEVEEEEEEEQEEVENS